MQDCVGLTGINDTTVVELLTHGSHWANILRQPRQKED